MDLVLCGWKGHELPQLLLKDCSLLLFHFFLSKGTFHMLLCSFIPVLVHVRQWEQAQQIWIYYFAPEDDSQRLLGQQAFLSPFHRQLFLVKYYQWLWSSKSYPTDPPPTVFVIMSTCCADGPLLCSSVMTSGCAFKAGNVVLGNISMIIDQAPCVQNKNPARLGLNRERYARRWFNFHSTFKLEVFGFCMNRSSSYSLCKPTVEMWSFPACIALEGMPWAMKSWLEALVGHLGMKGCLVEPFQEVVGGQHSSLPGTCSSESVWAKLSLWEMFHVHHPLLFQHTLLAVHIKQQSHKWLASGTLASGTLKPSKLPCPFW